MGVASSRRVIIHDRGIWKLGEYLCGKTAGYVRVILRDRCELNANQRFAFGAKCAPVGLEQKGFAGAVDIIKVCNKEDFCTVPNGPPGHGGSVRRRVCDRPNSDFDLEHPSCIIRERVDFRIRWCCNQREGDVVRDRNMRAGCKEAINPAWSCPR
jgi:hypothetical protein